MARVLEDRAKRLLASHGVTVPRSIVAVTPAEALAAGQTLGLPLVVKALVPSGHKGRSGAVRIVTTPAELGAAAEALLGSVVLGYQAGAVLVEQVVTVARELFLSITYDALQACPCLLLGASGGVDVESFAERAGGLGRLFTQIPVDPLGDADSDRVRAAWASLGFEDPVAGQLTDATLAVWRTFCACEADLVEINPLALATDGSVVAVGVLLRLDDDAMARHPELAGLAVPGSDRSWRDLTPRDVAVLAADAAEPYRGTIRYTEVPDGDIGTLGAGGGGSLVTFDLLVRYGLAPANYGEFGGNPSEAKVYALTRAVLDHPGVRALIVNSPITNNTRTDEVARGLVRAIRERRLPDPFPIVVRLPGVNEPAARACLAAAGIPHAGEDLTMEDAVARLAALLEDTGLAAGRSPGLTEGPA